MVAYLHPSKKQKLLELVKLKECTESDILREATDEYLEKRGLIEKKSWD